MINLNIPHSLCDYIKGWWRCLLEHSALLSFIKLSWCQKLSGRSIICHGVFWIFQYKWIERSVAPSSWVSLVDFLLYGHAKFLQMTLISNYNAEINQNHPNVYSDWLESKKNNILNWRGLFFQWGTIYSDDFLSIYIMLLTLIFWATNIIQFFILKVQFFF